jgi:hypothetical protein
MALNVVFHPPFINTGNWKGIWAKVDEVNSIRDYTSISNAGTSL